ncbi:4-carboxymuconolactone decarboxylase [Ramaria rubella]|nr:4-carboxymuconolactone decarboxylase [Ramaria rubella]
MGDEYVDNQLKKVGTSMSQLDARLTIAWGTIWTRPGLELKQRSLINIALLASQNHPAEVRHIHFSPIVRAVNNGATEIEIRETLLQAAVYCGAPTGMASFRTGEATIQTLKDEGKLPK